jgi:hypothetical protein
VLQWLRRWHERDDRPLVKRAGPLPDIDPIEELIRILGEANANSPSAGDIRNWQRTVLGFRWGLSWAQEPVPVAQQRQSEWIRFRTGMRPQNLASFGPTP